MVEVKLVSERFAVAAQIALEDLPGLWSMGFRHIINNRPDGEEPGQPSSSEVEAAAKKEGMTYVHVPFVGSPSANAVKAVLAASPKTLAYCRSGTRSVTAWAMAQATDGGDAQEIVETALEVGYNLSAIRGQLRKMSAR
jgi:uncharacterized protein (TIGR01244 family)